MINRVSLLDMKGNLEISKPWVSNRNWHTYGKEQIKPEAQGGLLYVLYTVGGTGNPVLRRILDSKETDSKSPRYANGVIDGLMEVQHGIVYNGVNEESIQKVVEMGPKIDDADTKLFRYNEAMIQNAAKTFLTSNPSLREMSRDLVNLIQGSTYLLPVA